MSLSCHLRGRRDDLGRLLAVIEGLPWSARQFHQRNHIRYARAFGRVFGRSNPYSDQLSEPCARLVRTLGEKTDVFSRRGSKGSGTVAVLLRISAYEPRWIQDPESWEPGGECGAEEILLSLLRHLFFRFPVPQCLERSWWIPGSLQLLERKSCIDIAQGKSLRDIPVVVGKISRRAAHLFATMAPSDLSFREALRWAQAVAAGNGDRQSRFLARTRMTREHANESIWLAFLARVAAEPDPCFYRLGKITDYIAAQIWASWPEPFVLRGRGLGVLYREADNFFSRMVEVAVGYELDLRGRSLSDPAVRGRLLALFRERWLPMPGVQPLEVCTGRRRWWIRELCTQFQLNLESERMRHCIASYGKRCRSGRSAIFRMSCSVNGGRTQGVVTVEVQPRERRVVEVRGRYNRGCYPEERDVLRTWAERYQIELGAWNG